MTVDDITKVSSAMHAMGLDEQPTFTLASIGTVLLDVFSAEPWTPAPFSHRLPGSPPVSSASSVADTEIITPQGSPTLSPLSCPPSPGDYFASSSSPPSPSKPTAALGGGALYALIGARVWLPPSEMRTVVDRAPQSLSPWADQTASFAKDDDDIPSVLEAEIEQFGPEMWVFNRAPGLRFPRAHIQYDGDARMYQHTVKPPLRTGHDIATGPLVGAWYLHVSPPYAPSTLLQVLGELGQQSAWRPKIVFEPSPWSCHPGEKDAFELVAQRVDILSPKHKELFALYDLTIENTGNAIRDAVEQAVEHLLFNVGVGAGGNGTVVIRCAAHGVCVATRAGGIRWTPSYYGPDSLRIKDETGAGNAFLGGFVAGLKLTDGNPYEAAFYGCVSASFVVEQYGLPRLTPSPTQSPVGYPQSLPQDDFLPPAIQNATRAQHLRAATGREMWNSDRPQRRLELLRLRAAASA